MKIEPVLQHITNHYDAAYHGRSESVRQILSKLEEQDLTAALNLTKGLMTSIDEQLSDPLPMPQNDSQARELRGIFEPVLDALNTQVS